MSETTGIAGYSAANLTKIGREGRSVEDGLKLGWENVKLFFREPLVAQTRSPFKLRQIPAVEAKALPRLRYYQIRSLCQWDIAWPSMIMLVFTGLFMRMKDGTDFDGPEEKREAR